MAIGSGQKSIESNGSFNRYVGVAPFFIKAINPTLDELNNLYPERENKAPEYVTKDDKGIDTVSIRIHLQSNPEHKESLGIDFSSMAILSIKAEGIYNRDNTKMQVINDFGETGWVNMEDYKKGILPDYMLKQNFSKQGIRPAFRGEVEVIEFLKAYLCIPNSRNYINGVWETKTKKEELEAALCSFSVDEIKSIIKGNVKVLKDAINMQPDNQIKFPVGVRITDEGKEYQEVYVRYPIRFIISNYTKWRDELDSQKSQGFMNERVYGEYPFELKVYSPEATPLIREFNDLPFDTKSESTDPFKDFGG